MAFSLLADRVYESILQISPADLEAQGVRLLLADLDNTLAPYGAPGPDGAVRAWARALEAQGVRLFLLSNNRHPQRPERFASALGVPFLGHAGKPRAAGFHAALARMGCVPAQAAIVGDQVFTDILGGKNAGIRAFLVEPIRLAGNPGRYLRYAVEWPFRALAKRRQNTI